jgi:branched-chain amino acid transport system permease protein
MLGGYGVAILTVRAGWPFWPSLIVSTAVTGLLGGLVAVPAMRLKGFYVAVVTLAFFFLAQYFFKRADFAGGFAGLTGVRSPLIFGLKIRRDIQWYYLLFALTALSVTASANIARSRFGRAFFAVRDNTVAAAGLGIHGGLTKIRAFFVGSLFAGLAGGLWTSYVSVIRLDQFTLWDSIWYVGMIIIGGAGSTAGAVAGVVFLRLISQVLHTVSSGGWLPLNSNAAAALTYAVYGLIIILFVMFQPYGLIAVWGKLKARIKSWPFGA